MTEHEFMTIIAHFTTAQLDRLSFILDVVRLGQAPAPAADHHACGAESAEISQVISAL